MLHGLGTGLIFMGEVEQTQPQLQ